MRLLHATVERCGWKASSEKDQLSRLRSPLHETDRKRSKAGSGKKAYMKKLLAVDDAPDILEVMQLILEQEGYQVQTSPNGACFHEMKSDLPDLILLDVLLAGEDGREICKQLKGNKQTNHIPVILISAHANLNNVRETCGADDYLAKPFRLTELIDKVRKHLF